MHTVVSCRIVIHLRGAARQDIETSVLLPVSSVRFRPQHSTFGDTSGSDWMTDANTDVIEMITVAK